MTYVSWECCTVFMVERSIHLQRQTMHIYQDVKLLLLPNRALQQ